jgi:hypothetical protein
MNPAQLQALVIAGVIELVLAAMSVLVVAGCLRAARVGLERSVHVGLRTPSTMRNEQSWIVGNRAAARTAPLYLIFNTAARAALIAAARHGWRLAVAFIGWICAVSACGITVFMLGSVIDGYVLASHQQLPPNPTFGFRGASASSCLPRWYATQKAGFSSMLFGYGPVLVASLLICVAAAIKRYSPWEICGLVLGTILLSIVFLVAAGIHADGVARVISC